MLRSLRLLGLLAGGVLAGFVLALFFQWQLNVDLSRTRTSFVPIVDAEGNTLKFPSQIEDFHLSIGSQPYKEPRTFDLFDEDKK